MNIVYENKPAPEDCFQCRLIRFILTLYDTYIIKEPARKAAFGRFARETQLRGGGRSVHQESEIRETLIVQTRYHL